MISPSQAKVSFGWDEVVHVYVFRLTVPTKAIPVPPTAI